MSLKRTLCNPRFGCGGGGVHDSPTEPFREPKYTLSRLPSLADAGQGMLNYSFSSFLRQGAACTETCPSSDNSHTSCQSDDLDERQHHSSTRALLHRIHAMLKCQSSTASLATVIVRPNMSIGSLYTGSRGSDNSSMSAHRMPTISVDEEDGWETDDEEDGDEECRNV
ncbi:hypothetical protein LTR22_019257 [Elasticomyces elasticus]|nr:hypothetical protein LTR22_019257 [Elasticomyces elasticus]KAK4911631.1 hypothetical protein LTR49_019795 [Elasticomyces elasticus]KAK5748906.1 hypothetical protein LTS12_021011 [Elasticomyces elasticus]